MITHQRWRMLGWTGIMLAGLVAGVQAASDPTGLVFVTTRDSHELVIIDAATDRILTRLPVGHRPHMAVIAPAGQVYITGTDTNDVTVVDAATLKVAGKIPAEAKGPEHAILSPDGKFLWVANVEGNAVSVIDVAVFRPGQTTPVTRLASLNPKEVHGVNNAALVRGHLFATNQDAGEVAVIDIGSDKVVELIPVGREPWEPYETPDHAKLLVPNLADETVSIIDVAARKVLATLPGGKDMTGVVVTADSKKAYVVRRGDDTVSVLDLERLQVAGEIPVGTSPEVATRTAGGKVYVANSGSGTVSIIDTATDRVVTTIPEVGKHPWSLASFHGYNYCH
jgi:YVTN family beta-propeller protein